MPYDGRDLDQHWFWQWLIAWWHQAITWTNVNLPSEVFCGIHLRASSQVHMNLINNMYSEITILKLLPDLPGGANKVTLKWHENKKTFPQKQYCMRRVNMEFMYIYDNYTQLTSSSLEITWKGDDSSDVTAGLVFTNLTHSCLGVSAMLVIIVPDNGLVLISTKPFSGTMVSHD